MGRNSKNFALILIGIVAISSVGLLVVKPASAQTATTPTPTAISTQSSTGPSLSVTNALILFAILLAIIIALVLRHRKSQTKEDTPWTRQYWALH